VSEPLEPVVQALERPVSLWADVRAALAGHHRDYTRGSLGRAILALAIPMVLEMSMQALFAVFDVFFVGRLGSDAVSVVGLTDSLLSLVFAIGIGLSMGATAMVARRIGEGSPERAAEATAQAIALGVVLSIPIAIGGVLFAPQLLGLMGAGAELSAYGQGFAAIIFGTNATVLLLFLINAAFRGAGDAAAAMRALWIANLINIALDPILIFGWGPIPAFGLEGAAIATAVGRGLGVVYQLYRLSGGRSRVSVPWRALRIVPSVMLRMARVSGMGVVQYLVSTASFLGLMRILAEFGDVALAGHTIAVRVIIFILLPAWGMGNAAATLVGQNLGAGNPDRAERSVWTTAWWNTAFLGIVEVAFMIWAEPVVGIFTSDPPVQALAALSLRVIAASYVFWGFGMITVLALNGAGDTWTPTKINFFAYWIVQIPLAWGLAVPLGMGPLGVFLAVSISQATLAVTGILVFRRGSWKGRTI
jgi:putative MATE family efflux protein